MLRLLALFTSKEFPEQRPKPIKLDKTLAFDIQMIGLPSPEGDNEEIEQELFLCQECLDHISANSVCDQCHQGREATKEGLDSLPQIERNLAKVQNLRTFLISRPQLLGKQQEQQLISQVVQICENVAADGESLVIAEKNLSKFNELLCGIDDFDDLAIYYKRFGSILKQNLEILEHKHRERRRETTASLKQKINHFKNTNNKTLQLNLNIHKIKTITKDLASKLSDKDSSSEDCFLEDTETINTISDYFSDFLSILLQSNNERTEDTMGMTDPIENVIKNWKGMSSQGRKDYILTQLNGKGKAKSAQIVFSKKCKKQPTQVLSDIKQ